MTTQVADVLIPGLEPHPHIVGFYTYRGHSVTWLPVYGWSVADWPHPEATLTDAIARVDWLLAGSPRPDMPPCAGCPDPRCPACIPADVVA